jgi:HD-GYP domain-containing protein (c-di-GMP phosphodiesterase class II)
VGNLSRELADALDLSSDEVEAAHLAGTLHDVGKVRLPDAYLFAPAGLSPAERAAVASHPLHGALLVAEAGLHDVARAIAEHHERWDGRGYPRGLAGDQIAHAARIVAVADAYVSLVTARADRPALSPDEALAAVSGEAASAYEPGMVAMLAGLAQHGELEL